LNGVVIGIAESDASGVTNTSSASGALFAVMPESTTEPFSLEEVFDAYYSCRRNKRTKASALAFEVDFETNLIELWRELNSGAWKPGPSAVFIVEQPVKREIFAAGFRDRVVYHVFINRSLFMELLESFLGLWTFVWVDLAQIGARHRSANKER
jgi:hypothetical protein